MRILDKSFYPTCFQQLNFQKKQVIEVVMVTAALMLITRLFIKELQKTTKRQITPFKENRLATLLYASASASASASYLFLSHWWCNLKPIAAPQLQSFPQPAGDLPSAIIIIGGSGSGKNTLANDLNKNRHYKIIDSDLIKEELPAYKDLVANGVEDAAMRVHQLSLSMRDDLFNTTIKEKRDLIFPGTGSDTNFYEKFVITKLLKNGYKIELILVEARIDICLKRVLLRKQSTGRAVPENVVKNSNPAAKITFDKLRMLVHESRIFKSDNVADKFIQRF